MFPTNCLPLAPEWSQQLLHIIIHYRIDWLIPVFKVITFLGEEPVMIFMLAFYYWYGPKKWAKWLTIGLCFNIIMNLLLKSYFQECRPATELWLGSPTDFSFPSGHSQAGIYLYVGFALLAQSITRKIAFITTGILIALSRVYLGVHFPHDILIGGLLGVVCILTVFQIYQNIDFPKWSWHQTGLFLLIYMTLCHTLINDPGHILPVVNGAVFGYILGLLLDSRFQSPATSLSLNFACFASLGTLIIWKGLKYLFLFLTLDHIIFTYFRYAALGFWISFMAYWIYTQFMGTTRVYQLWKSHFLLK